MTKIVYSSSSSDSHDLHPAENNLQIFTKQMLQSRLFIGTFTEKRYVEPVKSYRDIICISKEEEELIRDLEIVRKRLQNFYTSDYWIGISNPSLIGGPSGYCVWTELSEEIFGSYWFKIKSVRFKDSEILLRLKVVRPATVARNPELIPTECEHDRFSEILNKKPLKELIYEHIDGFTSKLTFQDVTSAFKFIFILLMAVIAGVIKATEFLGDYSLKFMRETSVLIRTLTPIIISCIDLIAKTIGGFYLLLAMLWRDRKAPDQNYSRSMLPNAQNQLYYRQRALPHPVRYRQGATITPID